MSSAEAAEIVVQLYESLQEKRVTEVTHFSWQGLEIGNITFSDELDFDPAELDIVYQDNDSEEQ